MIPGIFVTYFLTDSLSALHCVLFGPLSRLQGQTSFLSRCMSLLVTKPFFILLVTDCKQISGLLFQEHFGPKGAPPRILPR